MKLNVINRSCWAALGGLAVLAACPAMTKADGVTSGWYMGSDAGANFVQDIHTGGGRLSLNPGARWGVEGGYGFALSPLLTLGPELESGVMWNPMSSIESGGVKTGLGGNYYQIPVLLNAVLNIHLGKLTPYVGVGGGADFVSQNIYEAGGDPTVYAHENTDPAVQAQAGLRYQLTDHLDVSLGYKYLAAFSDREDNGRFFIGNDRYDTIGNHMVGIGFTYHF
jgi:OmpA-OmpF porin, OOP family